MEADPLPTLVAPVAVVFVLLIAGVTLAVPVIETAPKIFGTLVTTDAVPDVDPVASDETYPGVFTVAVAVPLIAAEPEMSNSSLVESYV